MINIKRGTGKEVKGGLKSENGNGHQLRVESEHNFVLAVCCESVYIDFAFYHVAFITRP